MKKNNRRTQILQQVEKLAANRRIHEITLDDVAQAAKVGKGTIYRYFKDKDDLFLQLATSGFDELCELLKHQESTNALFADKLLEVCEQISRFFEGRKHLLRLMQDEAARMYWSKPDIRKKWRLEREKVINTIAEILADGISDGVIRADIPSDVLATFLLGMLRTRGVDLQDASETSQQHELLVNLFLQGAGPSKKQLIKQEAISSE